MSNADPFQDLVEYYKGTLEKRPTLPATVEMGIALGTTLGCLAIMVGAVPGVKNFTQGVKYGYIGTQIRHAQRVEIRAQARKLAAVALNGT